MHSEMALGGWGCIDQIVLNERESYCGRHGISLEGHLTGRPSHRRVSWIDEAHVIKRQARDPAKLGEGAALGSHFQATL